MSGLWDQWLSKGKDWLHGIEDSYGSANQESEGLGGELAQRVKMNEMGKQAMTGVAPPMSETSAQSSPSDLINPGYEPIGGQNALDRIVPPDQQRPCFAHGRLRNQ